MLRTIFIQAIERTYNSILDFIPNIKPIMPGAVNTALSVKKKPFEYIIEIERSWAALHLQQIKSLSGQSLKTEKNLRAIFAAL